ncbi:hypothetical protein FQN49_005525 [Arthroderma sp. PD_2]|nr:hypothetical protein FQN49_005525 [Arthroderma sp. PD_2]
MRCGVPARPLKLLLLRRNTGWRPSSTLTPTATRTSHENINEPGVLKAKKSFLPSKRLQLDKVESEPSLPEKTPIDQQNVLEEFGLGKIPRNASHGTGTEIDKMGQLHITSPLLSERPHKTALLLSRAPASLTERDFLRILAPGKYIEGWRSQGGLEQIMPIRNPKSLDRTNGWVLVFTTPAAAAAYQVKVRKLRELLRNNSPFYPASGLDIPSNYSVRGSLGFALQDYTLTSPWQYPLLTAEHFPFGKWVNSCIRTYETITGAGTMHGRQSASSPSQSPSGYPVRICISRNAFLGPTAQSLRNFLVWDGKTRSVPWDLIEGDDKITFLNSGNADGDGLLSESSHSKPKFGEYDISNWRLMFNSASGARRFVRTWHMKDYPQSPEAPYCDPPPLIKAEALFWDDSF